MSSHSEANNINGTPTSRVAWLIPMGRSSDYLQPRRKTVRLLCQRPRSLSFEEGSETFRREINEKFRSHLRLSALPREALDESLAHLLWRLGPETAIPKAIHVHSLIDADRPNLGPGRPPAQHF